jgi:DHA1 family tetracycline resistance protein-like MFS transporter
VPVTLIVFVDVLGFAVVIPLLPFYAQRFGASPLEIGALFGSYAVCSLVAAPLLGRWSDRYGRKRVLLLSQAGSLLGFVIMALAPSLVWLFLGRVLDGLTAGNVATARAYIADVTPPKDRAGAFGVIAAAFGFGFLVGPAGAGLLAAYGYQLPLWIAAGLSATSLMCTWLLLPAAIPGPQRADTRGSGEGPWWRAAGVRPLLAQLFGFLFAFSMFTAGFALFCQRRLQWAGEPFGAREVGLVLSYIGLLGLMTQLGLLRSLVRRFGEVPLVHASLLAGALGYAVLSRVDGLVLLFLCLSLTAIANSAMRPTLLSLISQKVSPGQQGTVFGVTQSLQSLAGLVGPLLAGLLIQLGWLQALALACALALLLARALPWLAAKRSRPAV